MKTTLKKIHGIPTKKGLVTFHSAGTATQWHSRSHGYKGNDRHKYRYRVRLPIPGTQEMGDWCEENSEDVYSGTSGSVFWMFFNEIDATAFKLRWV